MSEKARLAEALGALSLATELAVGVPPETAMRASILGVALAQKAGLPPAAVRDVFAVALLRYIGCTGFAHETAWYGAGDDISYNGDLLVPDGGDLRAMGKQIVQKVGKGAPPLQRVRAVARTLSDASLPKRLAKAHCEQAVALSSRLGLPPSVALAVGQLYERPDGKGGPAALKAAQIVPAARVVRLALHAVLHAALFGPEEAAAVIRARRGADVDAALADVFLADAPALLAKVSLPSAWDALLEAEPLPHATLAPKELKAIALAWADFADLKSPWTVGHSRKVAALCTAAVRRAGGSEADVERAELAGWLHDLGRVAVPNGIWDKRGPLNVVEKDRMRTHAAEGARVLARIPLFSALAQTVSHAHERLDASGYPHGLRGAPSRVEACLAAADVYSALCEERPHRRAVSPEQAAKVLAEEARAGKLDAQAVDAVLAAAGQRSRAVRGEAPNGLSPREVEILRLLARGLTNKEIGKALFISARTAGNHIAHIYEKTGVNTRAAAALFAVQHGLAEE